MGRSRLALVALALALCACPSPSDDPRQMSGADLAARLEAGSAPTLLDVRTREEFARGRVPGARNVPHDELTEALSGLGLEAGQEVVVYCQSGRRASLALDVLTEAGYQAVQLDGDMSGWREQGLPCEECE